MRWRKRVSVHEVVPTLRNATHMDVSTCRLMIRQCRKYCLDTYLYNSTEVPDDVSEGKDHVNFESRPFGSEKSDGDAALTPPRVRIKRVYIYNSNHLTWRSIM